MADPFDGQGDADLETTSKNIQLAPPDFADPVWKGISAEAKGLLQRLLRKDPEARLSDLARPPPIFVAAAPARLEPSRPLLL